MQKEIIFITATLVLAFISRHSLLKPGLHGFAHGFYRFLAWECILGLFVLNMHVWYDNYYSPRQIISGTFFAFSLLLLISGLGLLHLMGKRDSKRNEVPMLAFEKTTTLITGGIYRYIRHPMYGSLILLGWGLFFKLPSWQGGALAATASIFMIITSRVEEQENINYFGEAYREYMKRSKMFVPFIL